MGNEEIIRAKDESLAHLRKVHGDDAETLIADARYGFISGLIHDVIKKPAIEKATAELNTVWQAASEEMYKASQTADAGAESAEPEGEKQKDSNYADYKFSLIHLSLLLTTHLVEKKPYCIPFL